MLVLMLVAMTLQLWPLGRAFNLCSSHTVRTGKVFAMDKKIPGKVLYFDSKTTSLIKHPCKENLAVYLGGHVFFTTDNFDSSIIPFTIPYSMQVSSPVVTSAHFAGTVLLFVINQKVFAYNYETNKWNAATGIEHPVSHVSGDNCCYSRNIFCLNISNFVFAYLHGEKVSQANLYYSRDSGHSFEKFTFKHVEKIDGTLGGIFDFHALSQVGLLALDGNTAKFAYSDPPLDRSFGLPFDYSKNLEVLIAPGQKGILVLWSGHSLQVSRNSGQLVNTVTVNVGDKVLHSSIFEANLMIHTIAANENELALLTQDNGVYYGSLNALTASVIQLSQQNLWTPYTALMFTQPGVLEILTPVPDVSHPAFDFVKCSVILQEILTGQHLALDPCKIEILQGNFENRMYTIDMNSELKLTATLTAHLNKSLIPLDIHLKQQQHSGKADPSFTSSIERPTISTVTLDVINKELSCINLQPLTAIISIGCDLDKKIVVHNDISSCSKGIQSPVALQDNFSYIIERHIYDPNFQGKKAHESKRVLYPYEQLGCPLLVYCYTPWKPVIELWRNDKFEEEIHTEYVLLEMNGIFTYSYTHTAGMVLCNSQPQNWTSIMANTGTHSPFSWNRENYVSCHSLDGHVPLQWPDVSYQILGGRTNNKLLFDLRNGIYIFWLSIVDPYYSYCHLETTFSVYTYGAFPPPIQGYETIIITLLVFSLLSTWLAYIIPKMSFAEIKQTVQGFCAHVCGCWGQYSHPTQRRHQHTSSQAEEPAAPGEGPSAHKHTE
ncbi:PREDICTED: cation channel sperm-associated protein subunit delta [Elephantulus edwardii]|uniref:cation channel sperm-associated protein subunit delta n=1 Tax=Elephantulus edwardii TaxID=28737 RepID=UPI0003F0976A|nr:PREDICTED: cation channel sperm-associated protein subunit delta [Elephantulus edwardii]